MLVQASHGPRIFALLLSSDGWTGQVLLASGAIVFTSFGRNLKKKMHALSLFGMHWPCLQLGAQETTRVFTGVHTRAPHGPFVSAHIPWMFQQHTVLYLPSQSTFFFFANCVIPFPEKVGHGSFQWVRGQIDASPRHKLPALVEITRHTICAQSVPWVSRTSSCLN